jgi:hypothetical protein
MAVFLSDISVILSKTEHYVNYTSKYNILPIDQNL